MAQLTWKCIETCGACCRLDPEERVEAIEALDNAQINQYQELVGEDGWCVNYNKHSRKCMIYENRPYFCKVSNLRDIFKLKENEADLFAIECCRDHIKSIYGSTSSEIDRFELTIRIPKTKQNKTANSSST